MSRAVVLAFAFSVLCLPITSTTAKVLLDDDANDAMDENQLETMEIDLAAMSDVTLLQVGLTHVKGTDAQRDVATVTLGSDADVLRDTKPNAEAPYALLQKGSMSKLANRSNRSTSNVTAEASLAEISDDGMPQLDQALAEFDAELNELVGPVVSTALNSSLDALEPLATAFAQQCSDARNDLIRTVNETAKEDRLPVFDDAVVEQLKEVVSALWIFAAGVDLAILALSGILDTAGQDDLASHMNDFKNSAHDKFANFVSSVDDAKTLIVDFDPDRLNAPNNTLSLVNTTLSGGLVHLDSWAKDFEQMFFLIGAGVLNAVEGSDVSGDDLFKLVRHRASGAATQVPCAARAGFNGIHEAAVLV